LEIPSNFNIALGDTAKSGLTLNKLQSGQQVYVDVVEQLPSKNTVILRIGTQLIQAKTDIALSTGQTLKVLVEKSNDGIILKLPAKLQQADTINASLRRLLPKQAPVSGFQAPLIKTLSTIHQQSTSPTTSHPKYEQLRLLSNDIIRALGNNKQLSSSHGLKRAILNSGILLEAKLLQRLNTNTAKPSLVSKQGLVDKILMGKQEAAGFQQADLKANLNKLLKLLQSWPKQTTPSMQQRSSTQQAVIQQQMAGMKASITNPALPFLKKAVNKAARQSTVIAPNIDQQIKDLLSKTEGALSKITLNQLASANTDSTSPRQVWQLEIPIFHHQSTESIFLKIERDETSSKASAKSKQQWTISVEMTPPKLGLIRNKLTLANNQVSANFWAEQDDTRQLIQQHLEVLRKQFIRAKLDAKTIQVQQGSGPTFQHIKSSSRIFNEKA